MTGLSYRRGAGCWPPSMDAMHDEEYTRTIGELLADINV
jgi:hypothetical protein